jgi:hypothetical protein
VHSYRVPEGRSSHVMAAPDGQGRDTYFRSDRISGSSGARDPVVCMPTLPVPVPPAGPGRRVTTGFERIRHAVSA